jgi:hypothetical protein
MATVTAFNILGDHLGPRDPQEEALSWELIVCVFSKYKHYFRCLLQFAEDRLFMNLVWDVSRIWSVVLTVVSYASRIWFVVSTEKRTKTNKMRACQIQSMPIFN